MNDRPAHEPHVDRWLRRCMRKARFRSFGKAQARLDRIANEDPEGAAQLRIYHCNDCDGFHYTKTPKLNPMRP